MSAAHFLLQVCFAPDLFTRLHQSLKESRAHLHDYSYVQHVQARKVKSQDVERLFLVSQSKHTF